MLHMSSQPFVMWLKYSCLFHSVLVDEPRYITQSLFIGPRYFFFYIEEQIHIYQSIYRQILINKYKITCLLRLKPRALCYSCRRLLKASKIGISPSKHSTSRQSVASAASLLSKMADTSLATFSLLILRPYMSL